MFLQWSFSLPNISPGVCGFPPPLIASLPPGSGFRPAGHCSCRRAGNWLGQTCVQRRVRKQELRSHHVNFRQTGQSDKGGELLSSGFVLFFSLLWRRQHCWLWSLCFFDCSLDGCSSKGAKGRAGSSKAYRFCFLHMEHHVLSCVWAGQPGNCCTFKYVVFLGHAQDSAVRKSLPLSRLSFHATVLLSNFCEVKIHRRALQMLLSGTFFAGCFGGFSSPCSFQVEFVGCTGWSEMLKFGSLSAAGQTQECYHAHPSLFWQDQ